MAKTNPDFRFLIFIANQKLSLKANEMFKEKNIPIQYTTLANGTAPSDIIDMLGLGTIQKTIFMSLLPRTLAEKMLIALKNTLYLGSPNTGVAFTVSLSGGSSALLQLNPENSGQGNEGEKMESKHSLILAFVNQGYSEEVMEAAKPAGATGGTVFHSRRVGTDMPLQLWGINVQEEREIVMILAEKDKSQDIMKAISEKCGIQSEAHGVVVSLPVDMVAGLNKETL